PKGIGYLTMVGVGEGDGKQARCLSLSFSAATGVGGGWATSRRWSSSMRCTAGLLSSHGRWCGVVVGVAASSVMGGLWWFAVLLVVMKQAAAGGSPLLAWLSTQVSGGLCGGSMGGKG
ncbi:hypothetical protein Dimus_032141, partial [Dionaea muscipula]